MVKRVNKLSILLLALFIVTACSLHKGTAEVREEMNGDACQKKVGAYTFTLKPYDSRRLMEVNYGDELDSYSESKRDSILKEYGAYRCFVFEIDIAGFTGDIADYQEPGKEQDAEGRNNYYLFGMQQDLQLKNAKRIETPCLIYYYERVNELVKTNRFIVGFKNPDENNLTLEYSNPYLNCGKINLNLNTPSLALN